MVFLLLCPRLREEDWSQVKAAAIPMRMTRKVQYAEGNDDDLCPNCHAVVANLRCTGCKLKDCCSAAGLEKTQESMQAPEHIVSLKESLAHTVYSWPITTRTYKGGRNTTVSVPLCSLD